MNNSIYKISDEERKFIISIRNGYHNRSFIRKIVKPRFFNSQLDFDKEFVQITDGILMERSDFKGDVDNTLLGNQIGENIAFGEINYLTTKLKDSVSSKFKNVLNYDILLQELDELPDDFIPKTLLVPIDHYLDFYKAFERDAKFEYQKEEDILTIGKYKLNIFWSNRYMDFKEIYLLSEDSV